MTARIEKTVFISYRRTNVPWALAVYQNLTMHGYDVFFDYQSIDSGNFEKIIVENIKTRAHFVVILTPSALERCKEPGDWLRREIETAMDEKRNIIPLMLDSFDFGSPLVIQALTGKLSTLNNYNGLRVYSEYFFEAMDKLRNRYMNVEVSETAALYLNAEAKEITQTQKMAASEAAPVEKNQLTAQEWFERGYVFDEDKNYDEAIRCYTESIRLKQDSMEAYNNRGLVLSKKGNLDGAIADFTEAIRINPDDGDAYGNRGYAIIENKGNIDDALRDLDIAIKLKANNSILHNNRGRAYSRKQEFDKAIADFNLSIEYDSKYAHPFNNRGLARRASGDLYGAIDDLSEAIRLNPDYPWSHYNRGLAYRDIGNFNDAISDFNEAIRLKADYANAFFSRGNILSMRNDNLGALSDFQKASELEPENGNIRASFAKILKSFGRENEAKEQEQIARELMQKDDEYNQACIEAICGNTNQALDLLKVAIEKKPRYRNLARQDPDFESIRDNPHFKDLVSE